MVLMLLNKLIEFSESITRWKACATRSRRWSAFSHLFRRLGRRMRTSVLPEVTARGLCIRNSRCYLLIIIIFVIRRVTPSRFVKLLIRTFRPVASSLNKRIQKSRVYDASKNDGVYGAFKSELRIMRLNRALRTLSRRSRKGVYH